MKLYIANVTKQHFIFTYWVPERSQPCTQHIPIGSQISLAPNGWNTDLTAQEIDHILKQHEKYGIRDANNMEEKKEFPFSGICYSIGKPVSIDRMRKAVVKQEQALGALGKQIRQEAAVAAQQNIEARWMNNEEMAKPMDISVEEVIPSQGVNDDLTHVSEGVRITRNPTGDMPIYTPPRR